MIEQHLKALAEEFNFPFNHLNKILACDLSRPFTIQLKKEGLKFLGLLPQVEEAHKQTLYLQFMQLNLALESCENLSLGLASDERPYLGAEFCFNLNYKQLKSQIETFSNHLDSVAMMIEDLNNKR